MEQRSLFHHIALSLVDGLGPVTAKKLLTHFGSTEQIFKAAASDLKGLMSSKLLSRLRAPDLMEQVDQELAFMEQEGIRPICYEDDSYPYRLRECRDAPLLLYYKGKTDLNPQKALAIVGTRNCTEYGLKLCVQLVKGLTGHRPLIVSGMALGIDIAAHRAAMDSGLKTVAVMGPGLNQIYPAQHWEVSGKIARHGGLLSEYPSQIRQDIGMFPRRNRIIAGMVDAVLVVESPRRGGAMITARLARGYDREVLAVPGRSSDRCSEGCNLLIKSQIAALVESSSDIEYALNWESLPEETRVIEIDESNLKEDELKVLKYLKTANPAHLDKIAGATGLLSQQTAASVLTLELKGIVRTKPGNMILMN